MRQRFGDHDDAGLLAPVGDDIIEPYVFVRIEVASGDQACTEGFTRLFKEHPDAAASIGDIIAERNRDRLEKLSSGDTLDGKGGPHRWLISKMRELFDF